MSPSEKTESKGLSQQNTTCPTLVFGRIPVGRMTDHRQGPAVLLSNPRVNSGTASPLEMCHSCHIKRSFLLTFHDQLPVLLDVKSN
jgi:hypothetical protein